MWGQVVVLKPLMPRIQYDNRAVRNKETVRRRSDLLVPSVIRLYLTGIENVSPSVVNIRVRDAIVLGSNVRSNAVLVEPGIYTLDFELPSQIFGEGDQPIVVTVTVDGVAFTSRLDDTSTRISVL